MRRGAVSSPKRWGREQRSRLPSFPHLVAKFQRRDEKLTGVPWLVCHGFLAVPAQVFRAPSTAASPPVRCSQHVSCGERRCDGVRPFPAPRTSFQKDANRHGALSPPSGDLDGSFFPAKDRDREALNRDARRRPGGSSHPGRFDEHPPAMTHLFRGWRDPRTAHRAPGTARSGVRQKCPHATVA
jgi:hypothetical protein